MIHPNKKQFRWGPIPGRLLAVSHWTAIYHWYPHRLHHYYWPEGYVIFNDDKMLYVNDIRKLQVMGGRVLRDIILTSKLNKFWRVWKKYVSNLFSFCQQINIGYLKSLSDLELRKNWLEFNNLIYLFWEPGIIPELAAYGAEAILKNALDKEKLDENKKREAFSILSAPTRLSFYQEEEVDLMKLIKKYHDKDFNSLLKKHQQKYFWVENSYFRTKVAHDDFFLNRIRKKIKNRVKPQRSIKEMYRHLLLAKKNKSRILKHLKNKKDIKRVSEAMTYCIWWQDQRKKYIFHYLHYLDFFVAEFARRAAISPRLFDFAWPPEISVKPSKKLIKILKERHNKCLVVHFNKNKQRCYYKGKARRIYNIFWYEKPEFKKDYLEGLVVYAGEKPIVGQVYIIKHASDLKKFPQGKILVTTMTAPEYITAIRKAKAIVTDTGGMTCHAAIVSRELKVPCIVGTKIATKFLKNGDKVEVDTSRGIIKKL